MKRLLQGLAALAGALVLVLLINGGGGRAQGPGNRGNLPSSGQPSAASQDVAPFPFQLGGQGSQGSIRSITGPLQPGPNSILAEEHEEDPNKDIQVPPEAGPWMICVASYLGHEAHTMARQMVAELRSERYKLPAYVFNHGAEARRKERQRVLELIKKQKEFLQQHGQDPSQVPIRVRYMRVQEQVAVLVGGYKDMDSARKALDDLRKLKPPDPTRVKLNTLYVLRREENQGGVQGEATFANPFQQAFVVRNPALPKETPTNQPKWDMDQLRRLNADENFSLLKCTKPYTLAVRFFQVPTVIQFKDGPTNLWKKITSTVATSDVDAAAHSAHNLADYLRKAGVDSYVLHTKYVSIVTVGAFDNLEDPRLKLLQERLANAAANPANAPFGLLPMPQPMEVPR